jgi:hypothetical protein
MCAPIVNVVVFCETRSELNTRGHWSVRHRRFAKQSNATRLMLLSTGVKPSTIALPVVVELVRVGKRLLDDDNLPGALKAIRDDVADWLGITDGPTDARASWVYSQEVGVPCVRLRIRSAT